MPLRIGNVTIDDSMDLKIGTELVGGLKVGSDIVYLWQAVPSPPLSENLYVLGTVDVRPFPRALHTLDRTTGVATRVGSAVLTGVNVIPSGLAWDGTNLYMVEQINDALYTLDRTTGVATRVGSATRFGVNETTPQGLAWDGTNLYMVGSSTDALYTLDRTTGVATRVGSAVQFDARLIEPRGLTWVPGAAPPPAPASHSFSLTADRINAQAAGKFGGLTETFTLGGQTYTITYLFTHANGIQFRFSTNAQALAFIAAGFTVDLGITGQAAFSSSLMVNRSDVNWAQYQAYPGRFVAGSTYTITITEAA